MKARGCHGNAVNCCEGVTDADGIRSVSFPTIPPPRTRHSAAFIDFKMDSSSSSWSFLES